MNIYMNTYEYCEQVIYFTDVKYVGGRCQGPVSKTKIIFPFRMYFADLYVMEDGVVITLILVLFHFDSCLAFAFLIFNRTI